MPYSKTAFITTDGFTPTTFGFAPTTTQTRPIDGYYGRNYPDEWTALMIFYIAGIDSPLSY